MDCIRYRRKSRVKWLFSVIYGKRVNSKMKCENMLKKRRYPVHDGLPNINLIWPILG